MAQRGAGSHGRFELKLLIDMNLSPRWVEALADAGIEARHWSNVGDGAASDREVFQWARRHRFVLLTHDLDFSRILALAGGRSPSVVLLRTHRLLPSDSAATLVQVLRRHAAEIETGAVVVVGPDRYRVRLLPLKPPA